MIQRNKRKDTTKSESVFKSSNSVILKHHIERNLSQSATNAQRRLRNELPQISHVDIHESAESNKIPVRKTIIQKINKNAKSSVSVLNSKRARKIGSSFNAYPKPRKSDTSLVESSRKITHRNKVDSDSRNYILSLNEDFENDLKRIRDEINNFRKKEQDLSIHKEMMEKYGINFEFTFDENEISQKMDSRAISNRSVELLEKANPEPQKQATTKPEGDAGRAPMPP